MVVIVNIIIAKLLKHFTSIQIFCHLSVFLVWGGGGVFVHSKRTSENLNKTNSKD